MTTQVYTERSGNVIQWRVVIAGRPRNEGFAGSHSEAYERVAAYLKELEDAGRLTTVYA